MSVENMNSYLYILVGIPVILILYFVIQYLLSIWLPSNPGDDVPNNVVKIAENAPLSLNSSQCFPSSYSLPPESFGVSFFLYLNQINQQSATPTMNSIFSIGKECNTDGAMINPFLNLSIANNSSSLMMRFTPEGQDLNLTKMIEFEIDSVIPLRKPVHYFLQCMPRGNVMMINIFKNGELIRSKSVYNPKISSGSGGIVIQTGQSPTQNSSATSYSAQIQRFYIFQRANELTLQGIRDLTMDSVNFS
jgi:hypothetical protein